MAVITYTYMLPLLLLLAALYAACLEQACCTFVTPFPAKSPFAALYPASLPGWFMLLCLALALSRACLGAGALSEVPFSAILFLELPFGSFGFIAFLHSAISLLLLVCSIWLCVLLVLCGCVSFAYLFVAPAFSVAPMWFWCLSAWLFMILLSCACTNAVSTPACTCSPICAAQTSCWRLSVSLCSSTLQLAPVHEFVWFILC